MSDLSQNVSTGTASELEVVVDLMRNLSMQTDPQAAAEMYGEGLGRLNLFPADRYVAISRRGMQYPYYKVTRSDTWQVHPDPWKQADRLPVLKGGMLAEILYSNQPAVVRNLPEVLKADDPAHEYLEGMELLLASPHFDNGQSINMGLLLTKNAADFPMELFPRIVFQANLWGRATLNLVTQQKLQAAYDRIDRELRVVAEIQRSLLPRGLPKIPGAELAAFYQTSQHAGGDYYDFFPLPDGKWGIFVADVSGHGTPAAVLMAITHAIAHTHPGFPMPPSQVLAFINEKLAATYTTNNGTFVTAFYGVYDPAARTLTYASAGHPPPRHIRRCEILGLDGETSLPLGIMAGEAFINHTLALSPGDRVLIYTDGLPDTFNPAGDSFSTERVDASCCRAGRQPNAEGFLRVILEEADRFAEGVPPSDDRTLVVLAL